MDEDERPTPLGSTALQGGVAYHLGAAAEAAGVAARRRIIITVATTTLSELRRLR